jgi:hypothetical protein
MEWVPQVPGFTVTEQARQLPGFTVAEQAPELPGFTTTEQGSSLLQARAAPIQRATSRLPPGMDEALKAELERINNAALFTLGATLGLPFVSAI